MGISKLRIRDKRALSFGESKILHSHHLEQAPQNSNLLPTRNKLRIWGLVLFISVLLVGLGTYGWWKGTHPCISDAFRQIHGSYGPSECELREIQNILGERSKIFQVADFSEDPDYEPSGKISDVYVSFRLTSKVKDDVTVRVWLTQQDNLGYEFPDLPVSRQMNLLPNQPEELLEIFLLRLSQDSLRGHFEHGSFFAHIEIFSREFGFIEFSGDHSQVVNSNLETKKRCRLEFLKSKEDRFGAYDCPVYVYQKLETRQYAISDFVP